MLVLIVTEIQPEGSPLEPIYCLLFLLITEPSSVVIGIDSYIIKSR